LGRSQPDARSRSSKGTFRTLIVGSSSYDLQGKYARLGVD